MDTYAGNNQDPISLHKYLLDNADAINGWDPTGHESLDEEVAVTTTQASLFSSFLTAISTVARLIPYGILGGITFQYFNESHGSVEGVGGYDITRTSKGDITDYPDLLLWFHVS